MPLPGSWLDDEAVDAEAFAAARKILYTGCPLCVDDIDTCRLCHEYKLNKRRPEGSRWATTDPRDHEPMPSPSKMCVGRIQFLEATGHVFNGEGKVATNKTTKPRPTSKPAPKATKASSTGNQSAPRNWKHKAAARNWKHKAAAKFTCRENKKLQNGRWKGNITSQGYPSESSEWEKTELRFVYRPPDYGPEPGTIDAQSAQHCTCCHLKPCIGTEMKARLRENMVTNKEQNGRTKAFTIKAGLKLLQKEHCRLFMKRYLIKDPILECINDVVLDTANDIFCLKTETKEDCEDGYSSDESSLSKVIPTFQTKPPSKLLLESSDEEEDADLFIPIFPLSQTPRTVNQRQKGKPNQTKKGNLNQKQRGNRVSLSPKSQKENPLLHQQLTKSSPGEQSEEEFEFTMS